MPGGPDMRGAGGVERSGVSIQNPDRQPTQGEAGGLASNILRKAAEAGPNPPPPPVQEGEGPIAVREITFWKDGFTIHEGLLMRYDDERNQAILRAINSGTAPLSVLDVQEGQLVELRVFKRTDEAYVAPPNDPGPFAESESRPKSPVPAADHPSAGTHFEVDDTLPTTSIEIRFADGTRIVSRMNLTHTVADIRNFIDASRPGISSTPYTIGTTDFNRILEDGTKTVKEENLENGVVVQWLL